MKIVRVILGLLAAAAAVFGVIYALAGMADGPVGMIPGGSLATGPLIDDPYVDWDPMAEVREIEMQLDSQSRSRTVWFLVYRGDAFIPCSLGFPPGKKWHLAAMKDGLATVRINGVRYRRTLVRVEDPQAIDSLIAIAEAKYAPPPNTDTKKIWFFRLES